MQIEVPESTVQRLVERLQLEGWLEVSGPDVIVRILNGLAHSTKGLSVTELTELMKEDPRPPEESAREMAERLGLVGAFESGHTDLSSNPSHMSGFGQ